MTRRVAARVDANQAAIVAGLRQIGASVIHLHRVGQGCPDLLVGYRGRNYLFEVKTARGDLTDEQRELHLTWPGQVGIIRTLDDALCRMGVI